MNLKYELQSDIIKDKITPGQYNINQMTREEVQHILLNVTAWAKAASSNWIKLTVKNYLGDSYSWTEQTISKRLEELKEDIAALRDSLIVPNSVALDILQEKDLEPGAIIPIDQVPYENK
jgi:polysaccharide deacetylase 2 family uncharacterized protein YibQ